MNGVENAVLNYVFNMKGGAFQFDFIFNDEAPVYEQTLTGKNKINVVPGRRRNPVGHARHISKLLKGTHYDIVWVNGCSLSDASLIRAAYSNKIKRIIIHAHQSFNMGGKLTGILHALHKFDLRCATDYWACSRPAADFFYTTKIINSDRFRLIHNAIDMDTFRFDPIKRERKRKELGLEGKFVIGHVGRFSFEKNHDYLLDVFYEIHRRNYDAVLVLAGDGALRKKIEEKARNLDLTRHVRFLGVRQDVPDLLAAFDVFALPSLFEGLPLVLSESQMASLRCFASSTVTVESRITPLLSFIDLEKGPAYWAENILSSREYERKDMTNEIVAAGYDIKTEAAKLEKYLLEM